MCQKYFKATDSFQSMFSRTWIPVPIIPRLFLTLDNSQKTIPNQLPLRLKLIFLAHLNQFKLNSTRFKAATNYITVVNNGSLRADNFLSQAKHITKKLKRRKKEFT